MPVARLLAAGDDSHSGRAKHLRNRGAECVTHLRGFHGNLSVDNHIMAKIAEVLEHKTLAMVKQYSHLSDHHVSSVVSKMNEKILGGWTTGA